MLDEVVARPLPLERGLLARPGEPPPGVLPPWSVPRTPQTRRISFIRSMLSERRSPRAALTAGLRRRQARHMAHCDPNFAVTKAFSARSKSWWVSIEAGGAPSTSVAMARAALLALPPLGTGAGPGGLIPAPHSRHGQWRERESLLRGMRVQNIRDRPDQPPRRQLLAAGCERVVLRERSHRSRCASALCVQPNARKRSRRSRVITCRIRWPSAGSGRRHLATSAPPSVPVCQGSWSRVQYAVLPG